MREGEEALTERILVTGAAGFIGHHLVNHLLKNTDWEVVCMVRVGGAGHMRRLNEVLDEHQEWDPRVSFVWHDLRSPVNSNVLHEVGRLDYIAHLAALTHVDNSITNPGSFVWSNVVGTYHMLEFARKFPELKWFNQFSTDECFGPAPDGHAFPEWARHRPTNPYAASKSGAEALANAYANCFGVPVLTTSTMNNVGERAGLEKFLPLLMRKIILGEEVEIHGYPDGSRTGSRFYIHARNVSAALLHLFRTAEVERAGHQTFATRFNVVGEQEINNLDLGKMVAGIIGKSLNYRVVNFHASRPGHDLRYALRSDKLFATGYRHPVGFEESLRRTVEWTLAHPWWIQLTEEQVRGR